MGTISEYLSDKYKNCTKRWWLMLILGIILFIIGLFISAYPIISYFTMSLIFGLIILFSGITYIVMSSSKQFNDRGWLLASGIIEVLVGLVLTIWPSLAASTLPFFLGFWLLFKGFTMIGIGSDMSRIKGSGWGWSVFFAVLMIICAMLILLHPILLGVEAVIIWVSITCIVSGIAVIIFSFKLKQLHKELK